METQVIKTTYNPADYFSTHKKIVNYQYSVDNILRSSTVMQKIKNCDENFQKINSEAIQTLANITKELVFNTIFNNFDNISQIIDIFENIHTTDTQNTKMQMAYEHWKHSQQHEENTNCITLAKKLQILLAQQGLHSYIIPFKAFKYINDSYLSNGHTGIIIPVNIENKNKYILLDPWIRIFDPIIFDKTNSNTVFCDNKNFCVQKNWHQNSYPYHIQVQNNKWDITTLDFEHDTHWLNPQESLWTDLVRTQWIFKIQKFTQKKNIVFFFNIMEWSILFQNNEKKIIMPFSQFSEYFESSNSKNWSYFCDISREFNKSPEKFKQEIQKAIQYLNIFTKNILEPTSYYLHQQSLCTTPPSLNEVLEIKTSL